MIHQLYILGVCVCFFRDEEVGTDLSKHFYRLKM